MNWFRAFISSPTVQNALHLWQKLTTPVILFYGMAMAPVRRLMAPVWASWRSLTMPLRIRWQAFSEKMPRVAWLLGWAGTFMKWGFYTLFWLFFLTWMGLFGSIPDKDELADIQTANFSEVWSQDSVLLGKYFIENRNVIKLSEISQHVVDALVSTEDKRFFEHSGIDYLGWIRVVYKTVLKRNEASGGGSTLSQQLAKNLYPRRNYWVPGFEIAINKIRENIIGIRLEDLYTKDEILALYLNTVPYGGDIFGVSVAAKRYFNKKAKELTVDQAALLIGMLKATTRYNPTRNPKLAKDRQMTVLRLMRDNGKITAAEFDKLRDKPLGVIKARSESGNEGSATYFREQLRLELPELLKKYPKPDGKPYNIYTDGLRIYTSIHSKMQTYAEEAVGEQMKKLQKQFDDHWSRDIGKKTDKPWGDDKWIEDEIKKSDRYELLKKSGLSEAEIRQNFEEKTRMTIYSWKSAASEVDTTMSPIDSVKYYFCLLNTGFMTMDHRNGAIRAWVGGINFKYFKYDHVESRRQVGSTFKPIVYAAALQDTMKPCDFIPNEMKMIVDWEPHNADEHYGGFYTMAGGLRNSVNVIAAQLIERVGIQKTIDLARKMGVTSEIPREYGISLGAVDVSLFDMLKVFGTIANHGVRPEPWYLRRIETKEGKVIVDFDTPRLAEQKSKVKRDSALTDFQASLMTRMLRDVIDHGTGRRFRYGHGIQGEFAGKTGTTQNQSDGWFICFNPQLVTGAWVGGNSPAVRFRSMSLGQGSAMALPICGTFWHKMASDPKFAGLVLSKFTLAKGTDGYFGCPAFVGSQADTTKLEELFPDSLSQYDAQKERMKARIIALFPEEAEPVEEGGGELPFGDEIEKDKKKPGQKIKDAIRNVFGGKKEDEKKPPQKPQPASPPKPRNQ